MLPVPLVMAWTSCLLVVVVETGSAKPIWSPIATAPPVRRIFVAPAGAATPVGRNPNGSSVLGIRRGRLGPEVTDM